MEDTNIPPIQYAIQKVDENNQPVGPVESVIFDTAEEAKKAIKEREGDDKYVVLETRQSHQPDPAITAAEEAQIEANGKRDIDEPSDGEAEQ